MNRETRKTAIFVGVALLLTGAAFVTIPDRTGLNTAFDDQGKKFFPEASDPNACASLEVIDYDPATASALPFKVEFKNGKWTIPSHHDYPADARERLSKTAGAVFDLAKDIVRSDRVEDHEKFGVVDPRDTKAASLKGQGKRITLKDASDKVLADFIIGGEVKDRPGYRYVRDPRYNRTYGVKVGADLSSKFGDWIEKNLLKVDATKIRRIVWDPTKVDPERGVLIRGDRVVLERKDASSPWSVPGLVIPPGRELDTTKINAMISALSDLQIVGVRTKPAGLTRDLQVGGESGIKLTQSAVVSLQNKGFYPTKDGSIYSNQGDMKIETDDGAVYTIRFGEVSFATGETLTSGEGEDESAEAKAKAAGKTEPAAKPAGTEENRYVMVTVGFQPDLVPAPPEPTGPPTTLPSDVFLRKPGTPEYAAQQKEIEAERVRKDKIRADQLAAKEKEVKTLSDRFADWYYVTPGSSYRSLALTQADLVHDKPATPPPGGPPGGSPFGAGGMPPDLGEIPGLQGLPPGYP